MVTGEKFLGVMWRMGYFGPDPKPSSGVVPLRATLRISAVLTHRKILTKSCKRERKKRKKKKIRKLSKESECALGV